MGFKAACKNDKDILGVSSMDNRYRSYNGSNNNQQKTYWGKAGIHLLRDAPVAYADNVSEMAERVRSKTGENIPNPRDVSNLLCQRLKTSTNHEHNLGQRSNLSDFIWIWSQFLEHELFFSEAASPLESYDIHVMQGDPVFEWGGMIPFNRSTYDSQSGTGVNNPRQQLNNQTAFLDGSSLYGTDTLRAAALRRFDGTGRLKSTESPMGELLSYNLAGFKNAQSSSNSEPACYFLSGDPRVNEHVLITAVHILLMREHNRLCLELPGRYPHLAGDDEATYQFARKIVGAIIQNITYHEFLPALLGEGVLNPYTGYKEDVNPSINTIFAICSFRLTHLMMPDQIRLGKSRKTLSMNQAYFNPRLLKHLGLESLFEGRLRQTLQIIDTSIPDGLRNLVMSYSGTHMPAFLDFASLTIQRGRDHGLPDYNTVRQAYGLTRISNFDEMTSDQKKQDALERLYQSVDNIDPWVGGMLEKKLQSSQLGALNFVVLKDQFERLRDGDRFWFEHDPMLSELKTALGKVRFSHIIKRNTRLHQVPENVFLLA